MISLEQQVNQLKQENAVLVEANASLKRTITSTRIECARTIRKEFLRVAGLSQEACVRLEKAFRDSTDNAGLKEAINCELAYAAKTPTQKLQVSSKQDQRVARILGGE